MDKNQINSALQETQWTLELASCERSVALGEMEERRAALRTAEIKYTKADMICKKLEYTQKELQGLLGQFVTPEVNFTAQQPVYNPETDKMQERKK